MELSRDRNTITTLFAHLPAGDIDAASELFTEDVTLNVPFQVPGLPSSATGRAAVDGLLRESALRYDRIVLTMTALRPMLATDRWVAEYTCEAIVRDNGNAYQNSSISTFRMREHLIAEWVEYTNPVPLAKALNLDL